MFRGEFVGLNGGADFYAADVAGLKREGEISLRVFLEACERRGIEPRKHFSGKFSLRVDPATHEAAVAIKHLDTVGMAEVVHPGISGLHLGGDPGAAGLPAARCGTTFHHLREGAIGPYHPSAVAQASA